MIVYNTLLVIILIGFILSRGNLYKKYDKNVLLLFNIFFFFIPSTFVMGFRYGVGTDYNSYESIFVSINQNIQTTMVDNIEYGFYYLNKFLSLLTNNPQSIFVLSSLLIMGFYISGIYKRSRDNSLSFLLFIGLGYYFNSMNGLRQFIAIAIVFFATHYLETFEKGSNFKFITWVVIASLFHKTALIMLIFLICVKYLKGRFFFIVTGLISLFIFLNINLISNLLIKLNIYTFYLTSTSNFLKDGGSALNIILSSTIVIFCLAKIKTLKKNELLLFRFKILWCAFLLFVFFQQFGSGAIRLSYYFSSIYLVLIPDILAVYFSGKLRRLLTLFLVIVLVLLYYYLLFSNNEQGLYLLPYRFRF